MKKLIAMLLAAAFVFGLCACGGNSGGSTAETTAAQEGSFRAGFGKADITPQDPSVPMGGYHSDTSKRMSTGLLSYLYAFAVAVQDGEGNTAMLVSVDMCGMSVTMMDEVRGWAQRELGIPQENIIISAVHQHSTPDPDNAKEETSVRYRNLLIAELQKAMKAAVEDLAPAEIYVNTVTTEALSFVRNYWTKNGTLAGTNYKIDDLTLYGIDRHESDADPEMRLLKFVRQDKNDILMVNFQAHPHMGTATKETKIHSDWPGVMRDAVTEALGVDCVYFSGASGNLNSTSRIEEENITTDVKEHGKRAAEYVIGAENSYTKVESGKVACREITYTYEADHSMDHLLPQATLVAKADASGSGASELLKKYPEIHSTFHANAVVNKAKAGATKDLTISAVTFGDVAFTCHPYEMFDTNGMELRSGTLGNGNYDAEDQLENPFAMTFIATKANASMGYIPSRLGYTNGGYSTDIARYAPGTGEQLVGDYLRLLNELHG